MGYINLMYSDYKLEDSALYKKFKPLIDSGLVLLPDRKLHDCCGDVEAAYRDKPMMLQGETHEVMLKAGKKVRITSRGSLRDIEIDGITYNRIEQAACSIYDPYNEYIDISYEVEKNLLDYAIIPIIDPEDDVIRYTVSKYSKGFKKYFDPKKVVKAVYTLNHILFYVKDKHDVLRKLYFHIHSINIRDIMEVVCKAAATKNGLNSDLYIAFFTHMEEMPFTVGARKEDFYALKDILDKISFKGTTPLKYMVFKELSGREAKYIKTKQAILFEQAMALQNKTKKQLCAQLKITEKQYDEFIDSDEAFILSEDKKKVDRKRIGKYLNMVDNFFELKYYESLNLIWRVKFKDIPGRL